MAAGSVHIAVLARLCSMVESTGIPAVVTALRRLQPGLPAEVERAFPNLGAPDLLARFRDAAKRLCSQYATLQGVRLAKMMRKNVETPNWLKAKEPREVRLVRSLCMRQAMCGLTPPGRRSSTLCRTWR
jgi:ribosomal protein L39E